MIIKTKQDVSCKDMEVLIRCAKINKRVKRLITLIRSFKQALQGGTGI